MQAGGACHPRIFFRVFEHTISTRKALSYWRVCATIKLYLHHFAHGNTIGELFLQLILVFINGTSDEISSCPRKGGKAKRRKKKRGKWKPISPPSKFANLVKSILSHLSYKEPYRLRMSHRKFRGVDIDIIYTWALSIKLRTGQANRNKGKKCVMTAEKLTSIYSNHSHLGKFDQYIQMWRIGSFHS